MKNTHIAHFRVSDKQAAEVFGTLNKVRSAQYYGYDEASSGYRFTLANGSILRIGQTDDDVAQHPGCVWVDIYEPEPFELEGADP